jgi:hypothetical protein
MKEWTDIEKQEFVDTLVSKYNGKITSLHISGYKLNKVFTTEQITSIMKSIPKLRSVTEYICFHGNCSVFTSDTLASSLPPNVQTLMLWNFRTLSNNCLATIRQHITLEHIIINFPFVRTNQLQWACFDMGIMALCCMENLHTLQIRCVLPEGARTIRQEESILSPEAMVLLLNSTSIQHLYLENCGLLDDHIDELYHELPKNKTLVSLHLKDNLFSDDCLFTLGRLLPKSPPQFTTIDVTGVHITTRGGIAAAAGMMQNNTLLSLQLESTWESYEFCDNDEDDEDDDDDDIGGDDVGESKKTNHSDEIWMHQINDQLRYNKAIHQQSDSSTTPKKMIPSVPYIPPHQLVVDRKKKYASITDIQNINDVVSVVSENISIVLKDVPAKAIHVVSKISDNVKTIYNQSNNANEHYPTDSNPMKPKQFEKSSLSFPKQQQRDDATTHDTGIPKTIICSLPIAHTDETTTTTKAGSPFSCSFD